MLRAVGLNVYEGADPERLIAIYNDRNGSTAAVSRTRALGLLHLSNPTFVGRVGMSRSCHKPTLLGFSINAFGVRKLRERTVRLSATLKKSPLFWTPHDFEPRFVMAANSATRLPNARAVSNSFSSIPGESGLVVALAPNAPPPLTTLI
jgi:hypothetical protein